MEKLMKPSEYAKELGISRQAVYAKIKRGILTAKDVEGKLYIVIDSTTQTSKVQASKTTSSTASNGKEANASSSSKTGSEVEYKRLLAAKDETIQVLKGTVEDLKESNRQMSGTLKGEIDLLKSAFSEMRSLYVHRIEQMKDESTLNTKNHEVMNAEVKQSKQAETLEKWVSTKKFLKQQGIDDEEAQSKVRKRLKKAYKRGDKRVSKEDGKLKVDISKRCSDLYS